MDRTQPTSIHSATGAGIRLGSETNQVHLSIPSALTRKLSITSPPSPCTSDRLTIRRLTSGDRRQAVEVINAAAAWYREFLPPEDLHDPEMDETAWEAEAERMTWWGASVAGELVGVMGSEPIRGVVLMRHAYVLPRYQRQGIASALLRHVEERLPPTARIVIGTYAANYKARGILEKAGYHLSEDSEAVLRAYYRIPEDRLVTSVTYEKDATG